MTIREDTKAWHKLVDTIWLVIVLIIMAVLLYVTHNEPRTAHHNDRGTSYDTK